MYITHEESKHVIMGHLSAYNCNFIYIYIYIFYNSPFLYQMIYENLKIPNKFCEAFRKTVLHRQA